MPVLHDLSIFVRWRPCIDWKKWLGQIKVTSWGKYNIDDWIRLWNCSSSFPCLQNEPYLVLFSSIPSTLSQLQVAKSLQNVPSLWDYDDYARLGLSQKPRLRHNELYHGSPVLCALFHLILRHDVKLDCDLCRSSWVSGHTSNYVQARQRRG